MPAPATPAAPTCVSLNNSVRLNWVAPANGGAVIKDYAIQRKIYGQPDGSYVLVGDGVSVARTYVNTGLTNGISYVYRIAAKNAIGWSAYSAASLPVTPSNVPAVMAAPSVVPGNGQVVLNWNAPGNGGAAITDYSIQIKRTAQPITSYATITDGLSSALTYTVPGLINGVSYQFRMRALNVKGPAAAWSASSAAVIPATVPNAPTGLTVSPGINQVTLSWTAPTSNGGLAITDYVIQKKLDGQDNSSFTNAADTVKATVGAVITGLNNGSRYIFRVAAINARGTGEYSANSAVVVPFNVPGQCNAPTCVRGVGRVTLSWTAPADNGSPITDYIIQRRISTQTNYTTVNDGASSATTYVNTGLVDGTGYVYRIAAVNLRGVGTYSYDSALVIPGATPANSPTNLVATIVNDTGVSLNWAAPTDNGGASITSYIVQSSPPNNFVVPWTTVSNNYVPGVSLPLDGFNDTPIIFRVAAINAAGTGTFSNSSNVVTPSNNLFDKSSWRNVIQEPYLTYLNKAADRWNKYIRYNSDAKAAIAALPQFSGFTGLRLEPDSYDLYTNSATTTVAACGVYWARNRDVGGGKRWNSITFTLEVNDFYTSTTDPIKVLSANQWIDAMTHELGHALGIGTFWDSFWAGAVDPTDHFLNGTTYSIGQSAYNTITGLSRSLIPLEDSGSVGTTDGHWEDNFRPSSAAGSLGVSYPGVTNELMIGTINRNGMVLSKLTIKSLVDFGWEEINVDQSEGNPTLSLSDSASMLNSDNVVRCGKIRNKFSPRMIDAEGNVTIIELKQDLELEPEIKVASVKPKSYTQSALKAVKSLIKKLKRFLSRRR